MDLGLQGKTAIVTGGASNIGKAISEGLFAEGANVVIADVDEAQAERVAAGLNASGSNDAVFVKTDVGQRQQVEHLAERALERFGQIDILVNNAGWTNNALFINKSYDDFEKEIDINLWGPIHCIRAMAPSMIERGYGKIITIGSDAGRVGEYNEAVYGACKGGIITLSKALAREFGKHGLNVNVVCPGLTLPDNPEDAGDNSLWHHASHQSKIFQNEETLKKVVRHYPLRRVGVPGDIVPIVLLLSSDQSSYITGQTISVSGGYAM
ncbi:MAG: SDR family oxidoreductase [Gammaproteobacteria bacterium]|jgi:2-hydroxycyclohexanecarboxyl-CoA dehydrogenase|nr:SDR family oxidoreductase [Gammaproteobacteria bacterium]